MALDDHNPLGFWGGVNAILLFQVCLYAQTAAIYC